MSPRYAPITGPLWRHITLLLVLIAILLALGFLAPAGRAQELGPDGERQWIGEPITLSLKDADLVETLRSFAKMGDFNLILDPAVSGKVTVELKDVPWDQALDAILRIHQLGMDITGGRVLIGPRSKIEAHRQAMAEVRTVELRLRHVPARVVARAFADPETGILTLRGTVKAEDETNTLVLRDRADQLLRHGKLLSRLDHPNHETLGDTELIERCHAFWSQMQASSH